MWEAQRQALISHIIAAGADPKRWNDLLRRLAQHVHGRAAVLALGNLHSQTTKLVFTYGMSAKVAHFVEVHQLQLYRGLFPRGARWSARSRDLSSEKDPFASKLRDESFIARDLRFHMGAFLPLTPQSVASVGFYRGAAGGAFGREEERRLATLLPTIGRSIAASLTFDGWRCAQASTVSWLQRLSVPHMIVSADGQVQETNDAGQAILRQRDGLLLRQGL
jgi:hypothetical protein